MKISKMHYETIILIKKKLSVILLLILLQILVNVIIHSYFLLTLFYSFFDIAGNKNVYDIVPEDNDVNCKNDMKLLDGVENVEEPKQGMIFNSLDELASHYRTYAKQQGFRVVQKNKRKHASGHMCYITLSCARQGSRKASSSKLVQTTRTRCKAYSNARLVDTNWYVTSVSVKHNHDLSLGKARYFRCNKNLFSTAKRKLLINDQISIH